MKKRIDRFIWREEDIQIQECLYCDHWYGYKGNSCKAFPNGIPFEVTQQHPVHRKPYPGDSGILFKERKSRG